MPSHDVRSYFDERSTRYEKGNWQGGDLFPQELAAIESLPTGLRYAVDLGSGPGKPVSKLATRARNVLAIDSSARMLALRKHDSVTLVADGLHLPLRDHVIDAIYLRMSMHYFNVMQLKHELHRIIKGAGVLLIVSIMPYGPEDENWFNERHKLKGKSGAYTPTIDSTVSQFSPSFRLQSLTTWTVRNSVHTTIRSNHQGDKEALIQHAISAPLAIRDLYDIQPLQAGDISMTVQWALLMLTATEAADSTPTRKHETYAQNCPAESRN